MEVLVYTHVSVFNFSFDDPSCDFLDTLYKYKCVWVCFEDGEAHPVDFKTGDDCHDDICVMLDIKACRQIAPFSFVDGYRLVEIIDNDTLDHIVLAGDDGKRGVFFKPINDIVRYFHCREIRDNRIHRLLGT